VFLAPTLTELDHDSRFSALPPTVAEALLVLPRGRIHRRKAFAEPATSLLRRLLCRMPRGRECPPTDQSNHRVSNPGPARTTPNRSSELRSTAATSAGPVTLIAPSQPASATASAGRRQRTIPRRAAPRGSSASACTVRERPVRGSGAARPGNDESNGSQMREARILSQGNERVAPTRGQQSLGIQRIDVALGNRVELAVVPGPSVVAGERGQHQRPQSSRREAVRQPIPDLRGTGDDVVGQPERRLDR
jgi:hypothetical protein